MSSSLVSFGVAFPDLVSGILKRWMTIIYKQSTTEKIYIYEQIYITKSYSSD